MDPQKMFNRVGPMLTPRAMRYLAGASVGVQATLLSGVDVGVVRANIEGLAGFAEAKGLTLDRMVALGSAPALGSYYDGALATAVTNAKNAASNGNLESSKAKKAKTRAEAQPFLVNALQFVQAAHNWANRAQNEYNATDWSNDSTGVDQGIAQGAVQNAINAANSATVNYDSAATFAQSLPASGGGGTPTPSPETPPTTPPETAKSSTPWGLIAAGVAAGLVILYVVTSDEKKNKPKHLAAA